MMNEYKFTYLIQIQIHPHTPNNNIHNRWLKLKNIINPKSFDELNKFSIETKKFLFEFIDKWIAKCEHKINKKLVYSPNIHGLILNDDPECKIIFGYNSPSDQIIIQKINSSYWNKFDYDDLHDLVIGFIEIIKNYICEFEIDTQIEQYDIKEEFDIEDEYDIEGSIILKCNN